MQARGRLTVACVALGGALVVLAVAAAASNPAVSALRKSSLAHSSVARVTAVTRAPGVGVITMAGKVEQRGKTAHMLLHMTANGASYEMEGSMLFEQGDLVIYLRSPLFQSQLPAGKKWLRIDLQKEGAKLGLDFSALLGSPTSQSTQIVGLGVVKTTSLGRARVARVQTSHYRLRIDYDLAARRAPALRRTISKIEQLAGITSLKTTEDVWVGPDGRVRQLRTTMPGLTNGIHTTTTQTYTFLSYNTPVTVSRPPAALVYSP